MAIIHFSTRTRFFSKQFTLSIIKWLTEYKKLISPKESFRKRVKSVTAIIGYTWIWFIKTDEKMLCITHFYEHFRVYRVPCVSTCASVHCLIFFYTVTKLISQTGKTTHTAVCETLLTFYNKICTDPTRLSPPSLPSLKARSYFFLVLGLIVVYICLKKDLLFCICFH